MKSFLLEVAMLRYAITFLLLPLSLFAEKTSVTILIDPGHGGNDPGHLPVSDDI